MVSTTSKEQMVKKFALLVSTQKVRNCRKIRNLLCSSVFFTGGMVAGTPRYSNSGWKTSVTEQVKELPNYRTFVTPQS
jgi:hypothetical protein